MNRHPSEALRQSRLVSTERAPFQLSFEFFPPKTDVMEERFWDSISKLAPLKPRFVSVTYGAGGSTRERTLRMVSRIQADTGVNAAAHLTCVGATRAEVDEVVRGYRDAGITPHRGASRRSAEGVGKPFAPHPEGYKSAADLVAGIRKLGDFDISVAAYPEKHPQSADWGTDIDNLKRKIDAGADRCDHPDVLRQRRLLPLHRPRAGGGNHGADRARHPADPLLQADLGFRRRSAARRFPNWVAERFDGLEDDPETHALVAAAVAAEQVLELVDEGVTEFHFYTLNRSNLVLALARLLGVRPD